MYELKHISLVSMWLFLLTIWAVLIPFLHAALAYFFPHVNMIPMPKNRLRSVV